MKTATKNLEDDHVHILRLTDVMMKITVSDNIDINHIGEVIDLIRNFADGLHHAKEENLFFPLLAEKGFSIQQGPLAVMLHEHSEGRNYVKRIAENIPLYINGAKSSIDEIFADMQGYAELLRNHISKENNILFRMADKVLSETDNRNLLTGFESAEKTHDPGMGPEDFIARIEHLASIYKI